MKKALLVVCALAVSAMALTSCVSTHYESQASGDTLKMEALAVKDYDIVAPVTVTATTTEKASLLMIHQSKEGSEILYPALLNEAVKVGGNDVINVRVTKKQDSEIALGGVFGKEVTYTYTATALAIKYNNKNIVSEGTIYNSDGNVVTTTKNTLMAQRATASVSAPSGLKGILNTIKSKLPKLF